MRINDFVSLWEDLGFQVEVLSRAVRVVRPDRVHTCWMSYKDEDLYCYEAVIKAVKRGGE